MPDQSNRSRRAVRARREARRRRMRVVVIVGALAGGAAITLTALFATGDGGGDSTVAELRLVDFGIEGDLEVEAGRVRLSAINVGVEPHNVGIRGGPLSNEVPPGGSIELDIGELQPGTYELYCDVPGHEALGMVAPFVVTAR